MLADLLRLLYLSSNEYTFITGVVAFSAAVWKGFPERMWKKKLEKQPIGFQTHVSTPEDESKKKRNKQPKNKQYTSC